MIVNRLHTRMCCLLSTCLMEQLLSCCLLPFLQMTHLSRVRRVNGTLPGVTEVKHVTNRTSNHGNQCHTLLT